MRLQALDQRARCRTRRAVGAKLVPEPRRPQPALRLIEGVGIGRVGLDLLDQSGNIAVEAVILDRGRHLSEMVAVLDPLRNESGLRRIIVERCSRGVERRQRRRIEQRLHTRVALRDVDNVPVDVVDRTPDILSEVRSRRQRAGCWSVGVLDGRNFLIELIDDDVGVQIGEVVDLGIRRAQHLLHADQVRDDQVDLIRADAANLAGRGVVE